MNEMHKFWLLQLFDEEIQEELGTIKNEELWNLGYEGEPSENPHPGNIKLRQEYVDILKKLRQKVEDGTII